MAMTGVRSTITPEPIALVFDCDGVLLESNEIKTEAFAELFSDRPEHVDAIVAHHTAHLGLSRYEKFRWIYGELLHEKLSRELERRLGRRFSEIVYRQVLTCPLVPGAHEALSGLVTRARLFVASGTPQRELDALLEARGLNRYFECSWGSPTAKAEALRRVMERCSCGPERMVMIGDSTTDLGAAREIGVHFVGRRAPGSPGDLARHGVPVVDDLFEMMPLLGLTARDPGDETPGGDGS